jgi:hypothetical protein
MVQVPTGIITQLEHPPYGVLQREFHGALSFGLASVQRIRQVGPVQTNVDAFGLTFDFLTVPDGFGYQLGLVKTYEEFIVEFAPVYTMFDGHNVYGPRTQVFSEGSLYYLSDLFPTRVDVYVQVGCVVDLFWLVAL